MMNNLQYYLVFLFACICGRSTAQATFTMIPNICVKDTLFLQAQTGTLTATSYSWDASSFMVQAASPHAASTTVIFNAYGTYTITLTVNGTSTYTQTINVLLLPNVAISASAHSLCTGFTSVLTALGDPATHTWYSANLTSPVVQSSIIATPGNYSVVGVDASGCKNTATINIGVEPPITLTLTQSSPTTCITSNNPRLASVVDITAQGAISYIWTPFYPSSMSSSIAPTLHTRLDASQCYTVTGSTTNCSATAVICVSVIPQFTYQLSSLPDHPICAGEPITVSVSNISPPTSGSQSAFSCTWAAQSSTMLSGFSSAFPTSVLSPTATISYTLGIKDSLSCISSPQSFQIFVNPCTSLKEFHYNQNFILFPNPVNNKLTIQSPADSKSAMIEIRDNVGKVVYCETFTEANGPVNEIILTAFSPGLYLVSIYCDGALSKTTKVIIQ